MPLPRRLIQPPGTCVPEDLELTEGPSSVSCNISPLSFCNNAAFLSKKHAFSLHHHLPFLPQTPVHPSVTPSTSRNVFTTPPPLFHQMLLSSFFAAPKMSVHDSSCFYFSTSRSALFPPTHLHHLHPDFHMTVPASHQIAAACLFQAPLSRHCLPCSPFPPRQPHPTHLGFTSPGPVQLHQL